MNGDAIDFKKRLTPEQYQILRQGGTEPPFTGKYYTHDEAGMYRCAACEQPLFSSETKYESKSGWPSFYEAVDEGVVTLHEDRSHGMVRTEVRCGNCDSHLGHVFDDGARANGQTLLY